LACNTVGCNSNTRKTPGRDDDEAAVKAKARGWDFYLEDAYHVDESIRTDMHGAPVDVCPKCLDKYPELKAKCLKSHTDWP
jgi:hypothetical protein